MNPEHPWASRAYHLCERLTEATLYVVVVFNPWVFGTALRGTVWVMNGAGYLLGALLAVKVLIRWTTGIGPVTGYPSDRRRTFSGSGWPVWAMAVLTVLLLVYVLAGAVNARAVFNVRELTFEYFPCIAWLPHSYDRSVTWFEFWEYLGLACTFWAARDWLRGTPARELAASRIATGAGPAKPAQPGIGRLEAGTEAVDVRLRRLLMVICLNGALVGLEGIVQRSAGSDKLLFLVQPRYNPDAAHQFGPYANRNNAAEYFNLVWPVCAGLAWLTAQSAARARKEGRRRPGHAHVWLTVGTLIIGVCPVMSDSRGGALVSLAMAVVVLVVMLVVPRRVPARNKIGLGLLFAAALQGAVVLGWDTLQARLETIFTDNLGGRLELYREGAVMARDYPWLGSGAGTFASLYYLYNTDSSKEWAAYLHNDWLEFRVTLGWIGFSLLLALLAGPGWHWLVGGGPRLPTLLAALIAVALAGCLFHARFDFPFRVHSIATLFLLYCAIFASARRA